MGMIMMPANNLFLYARNILEARSHLTLTTVLWGRNCNNPKAREGENKSFSKSEKGTVSVCLSLVSEHATRLFNCPDIMHSWKYGQTPNSQMSEYDKLPWGFSIPGQVKFVKCLKNSLHSLQQYNLNNLHMVFACLSSNRAQNYMAKVILIMRILDNIALL